MPEASRDEVIGDVRQQNMPTAIEQFDSTIERSLSLINLGKHLHSECPKHTPDEEDKLTYEDMGRAAVVLAVSAMDAFFTRRFSELLVPYLKSRGPTKGLTELLASAGLDTEEALVLIGMERPYRRVRSLASAHLARYTTQRFSAIDSLFSAYGLGQLCLNAMKRAKRKNLLRSVEYLVERRHNIVHAGDHNQQGRLVPFDFDEMKRRIAHMELFVDSADAIISSLASRIK